jgi:hypothetical protein
VRRHDPDRGIADRGGQDRGWPARRAPALAHGEQRADQGSHHVVAERVRHHRRDRDAVPVALEFQAAQRPDGGRPRPAAAERGEIVLAQDRARRLVHGGHVQLPEEPQRLVPAQRIRAGRVVAHAVGVAPPQRGEPGVEPVGRDVRAVHPDVGRQHARQPGYRASFPAGHGRPGARGHVRVHDLPARVHPGVGAPGHGQARRAGQPQHLAERGRQDRLDGAPAGLCGPPGKP